MRTQHINFARPTLQEDTVEAAKHSLMAEIIIACLREDASKKEIIDTFSVI